MLKQEILRQSQLVNSRRFDENVILIDPENALLHELNVVGTRIWELCDGTRHGAEIAAQISREFEVSLEQAEADVGAFLDDLKQRALVAVGEGGGER